MKPDVFVTPDARRVADQWLSFLQTDGKDIDTPADKDYLCEPGNINKWMLYYFPTKFIKWEPMNDYFFHFVETRQKGLILFPGGHGKDLACDTPILTTLGWKTMGTVRVGDEVYAADGSPTKVTYVSEVFEDHACYRLTFGDGAEVVAGEDHLWWVGDQDTREPWRAMSTRAIAESSWRRDRPNGQKAFRWRVRCDAVVDPPEAELPIDPYIFGYWLGDGHSDCARITVGEEDLPALVGEVHAAGYSVVSQVADKRTGAWTLTFNIREAMRDGFMARAMVLGVLGNKHIPESYLTASRQQRLDLLAGLMDSDGSIHQVERWPSPRVEFSVCSELLARGVHRLLRSLGVRVAMVTNDATLNGEVVGKRYRLSWTPTFDPFRLARKSERFREPATQRAKNLISIVNVEPTYSRPTRCIQVEHPSHVFLVGELFTPTHNTTMELRWPIRIWATAPSAAVIYTEKNQPTANMRGNAVLNELATNRRLIHHYGVYKPPAEMARQWAASAFTIRQREIEQDTPSFMAWGAGGGSSLGWRCNVLLNDDPVTPEIAKSATDMKALKEWFNTISKTSPSPLPIEDDRYLIKHFLIGTAWTMDDLYATTEEDDDFEVLKLSAVIDEDTGETLSDRFCYEEPEALARKAETDPHAQQMVEGIEAGKINNLYTFKYGADGGITAFYRRYQNKPVDPEKQKFAEAMFEGVRDKETGIEYPGCWDESHTLEDCAAHWVTAVGLDPMSSSLSKRSKRCGLITLSADPAQPDHFYLVDIDWGKWPQESVDLERKTQMGQFVQMVHKYDARGYIESNACQLGLQDAAKVEASRRGLSISVRPHHTGSNKLDIDIGIEGMVPMIESGRLHLPAATKYDRLRAKELVSEFVLYGVYPYTDILMAFWFAWFNLKARLKVSHQAKTPPKETPAHVNRLSDISFPSTAKPASIVRYLMAQGWPEGDALELLVARGYELPEQEEVLV